MRAGQSVAGCGVVALAAGLAMTGAAVAQVTPGTIVADVQTVATGLISPILGVDAGDGSGRFYIVDQAGRIFIMHDGVLQQTPFLDLTSTIVPVNPGYDERGLLGLAFHPDYAHNGRFFVRYSVARQGEPTEPCFGTTRGCHEEILAEFRVSSNPNHALPEGTILFRVNKPEFNHNSGDVAFGADGYLYFGLGDGGGANDDLHLPNLPHGPIGNGQNVNAALGKILRIDVDSAFPYAIPATNPFANGGGRAEVWAWGLRNPYRFSFDNHPGGDNRMWLTDVGQDMTEELNIGQLGQNFGWAVMEGPHCFDPFHTTTPPPTCANQGMTPPIASYDHDSGIAIVGGFVYRGSAVPQLRGKYVFGDFSLSFGSPLGRLMYIDTADPQYTIHQLRLVNGTSNGIIPMFLKGFGQDKDGEIYAMVGSQLGPAGAGGQILKIIACAANCDGSTEEPVLNVNDFVCFMDQFAQGRVEANCDLSTLPPVLNVNDYMCFVNRFVAGCP